VEKDNYREAVKAMIEGNDSDMAAIPEPKRETDPYIQAQLSALRKMIDASYDPETGQYAKKGVIEFMFEVMNDSAHAIEARLKAATTLISFFHKKVPNTLMVAQQANLADVDLSVLAPEELDAVERLLNKAVSKAVLKDAPAQATPKTLN
jgi:hypothetical protein